MDWWNIFFRIRRIVFASIAILSLLWAIVLAVYIAKEWTHFVVLQRVLVLSIIGVNVFTSILLYLMIVVVFRVWLDLARMLFLLLLHTGVAVLLTLYGQNFSCAIFHSSQLCKDIDLAFVVGSWALTGLNLGYMIYLLIMVPVPRPLPQITPNPLLESRRSSMVSVNSTTGLLQRGTSQSYSVSEVERQTSQRTVSKRLFVANTTPTSLTPSRKPSRTSEQYSDWTNDMASPVTSLSSMTLTARTPSVRSWSTRTSIQIPLSLRSGSPSIQRHPSQASNRTSRPLQLPNPFWDPLSRNPTPDSLLTVTAVQPGEEGLQRYRPLTPSTSSAPPPYAAPTPPFYILSPLPSHEMPDLQQTGAMLRLHAVTPHSIHSLAPSMHLPQPAHVRGSSDVIYRPHSADPTSHAVVEELPNPFPPLVSRAEVRRFASLSGSNGEPYAAGHGGTYYHASQSAAPPAVALSSASPGTEAVALDSSQQWKQLVWSAAVGR